MRNKKWNLISSIICLVVGLALVGAGIYYLAEGNSTTGGVIFGLGVLICVIFVLTLFMMKKLDKMKEEADAIYAEEKAKQEIAIRIMMDRIREADGNLTQEELSQIVADAKNMALSDEPLVLNDEKTTENETIEMEQEDSLK